MNTNRRPVFRKLMAAAVLLLAACAGGPRVKMAPGYDTTPTREAVQANILGTPEPTAIPPTPTPQPLALDDAAYSLPSKALSFRPPLGWQMASEDVDYVRFIAPDQRAWMEAAVESSGYALEQAEFEKYAQNLLVSLYLNTDSHQVLDSRVEEGQAAFTSSLVREGVFWFEYDVFIQRGEAIYSFSFQTLDMLWDAYLPGFQAVTESMQTSTGYVNADMIYSFMRSYAAPNKQFTLTIPMSWTFELGQTLANGAQVDSASAPDGQAAVHIAAFDGTQDLKSLDVGQVSIPVVKQMESQDLRITSTDLLNDGRIRVNWQVDADGTRGFSFFWQENNIVYILTLKYADQYAGTFKEVMDNIGDSFRFPEG